MEKEIIRKYLDGSLSEKENLNVQIWIADHRDDERLVSWIDGYFEDYRAEEEFRKGVRDSLKAVEKRLGLKSLSKSALLMLSSACAAALILLPFSGFKLSQIHASKNEVRWTEINVPYGQTRKVMLSDGTSLMLNAGTKLMYPETFIGSKREVFIDGEALADVAKDSKHPFIIRSGSSQITVTGTKFNFKSFQHDNAVEIALLEGSVEYTWDDASDSKNVNLKAGDLMRYDKGEAQVNISAFNVEKFKSIESGHPLRFFNESLADIASVLERTFDKKIVITDKELAKTPYLAFFLNNESLDEILSALNTFGKMTITKKGDIVIIDKSQY